MTAHNDQGDATKTQFPNCVRILRKEIQFYELENSGFATHKYKDESFNPSESPVPTTAKQA